MKKGAKKRRAVLFDRAKLAVSEAKLAEESMTGQADCRSCSRSCETISVNRDMQDRSGGSE